MDANEKRIEELEKKVAELLSWKEAIEKMLFPEVVQPVRNEVDYVEYYVTTQLEGASYHRIMHYLINEIRDENGKSFKYAHLLSYVMEKNSLEELDVVHKELFIKKCKGVGSYTYDLFLKKLLDKGFVTPTETKLYI